MKDFEITKEQNAQLASMLDVYLTDVFDKISQEKNETFVDGTLTLTDWCNMYNALQNMYLNSEGKVDLKYYNEYHLKMKELIDASEFVVLYPDEQYRLVSMVKNATAEFGMNKDRKGEYT